MNNMVCVMCNAEIKTSKPILTMSDTLFLPNGRWEEHLTVDSLCSMDCMKDLLKDEDGNWLDDERGVHCEDGVECDVCKNKFDAGHIISLGWKKNKREKWHKIVTSRNYCGHQCLTSDLDNDKSPLHTNLPKKPAKKKAAKKKPTKKAAKKPSKSKAKKKKTTYKKLK
jgi:hypothetical protein